MSIFVTPQESPIQLSFPFMGTDRGTSYSAPFIDPNPHLLILRATNIGRLESSSSAAVEDSLPQVVATTDAITEIRRISGLTWEQIGELFGKDRRTVQFWASGRPLRPTHEEYLLRAHEIIRRADCGDPSATRAFILDTSRGFSLKDLLSGRDWTQAELRVQGRVPQPRPEEPRSLSASERNARRPVPLETALDRNEEPVKLASTETLRAPSRHPRGRT